MRWDYFLSRKKMLRHVFVFFKLITWHNHGKVNHFLYFWGVTHTLPLLYMAKIKLFDFIWKQMEFFLQWFLFIRGRRTFWRLLVRLNPLAEEQVMTAFFCVSSQTRCPTPEETLALIDAEERSACHTPRCNWRNSSASTPPINLSRRTKGGGYLPRPTCPRDRSQYGFKTDA